jgi:hypothetical protein
LHVAAAMGQAEAIGALVKAGAPQVLARLRVRTRELALALSLRPTNGCYS